MRVWNASINLNIYEVVKKNKRTLNRRKSGFFMFSQCYLKSVDIKYSKWDTLKSKSNYNGMSIIKKFGQNLKKVRTEKGISQEQLAFMAKLHRTYISDVERGNRNISLINIEKIAKALKIDPKNLLNDL